MDETPTNERQYLFRDLESEVNKDYASIVTDAWGRVKRAEEHSAAIGRKVRGEARIMERCALLVIKNHEYLVEDITPERRIKRDRERYERAWEKDKADSEL